MSKINVVKRDETTNRVLSVETSHTEIGYAKNAEIVARSDERSVEQQSAQEIGVQNAIRTWEIKFPWF